MGRITGSISGGNNAVETGGSASASTAAPIDKEHGQKFGEVWKDIQAKYGEKPEKPREIKKNLGKDDFLKIMVTQMKHQDPTKPFDAEQMAAQMAQYASVEQLQNMNQGLNKMATNQQPLERLAMTNLIGKTVTVDRERFSHVENQGTTLGYTLPREAVSAKVSIYSDTGELLIEKDEGKLSAGDHTVGWDGVRKNGLAAKSGSYIFKIDAKDASGVSINMDTKTKTKINGISFEGAEPSFLIGDLNNPQKVAMRNVVRIEVEGVNPVPGTMMLPADSSNKQMDPSSLLKSDVAMPSSPPTAPKSPENGKFFNFTKGVGSKPIEPGQITPEVKAALAQYDLGRNGGGFPSGVEDNIEKGGGKNGQ